MLAVQGYFDGVEIKPLEKINVKRNQKVIITIMDEFINPEPVPRKQGMRGALAKYANPALQKQEKKAWEQAVAEKYGNP